MDSVGVLVPSRAWYTVDFVMVLRSPWLVAGRPLMCSTLTEGPCSPLEQTLICLPKWVAAAWAVSSSALTLLFTHSGPSLLVVFQGAGSQRRNEITPSEGLEILRERRLYPQRMAPIRCFNCPANSPAEHPQLGSQGWELAKWDGAKRGLLPRFTVVMVSGA